MSFVGAIVAARQISKEHQKARDEAKASMQWWANLHKQKEAEQRKRDAAIAASQAVEKTINKSTSRINRNLGSTTSPEDKRDALFNSMQP